MHKLMATIAITTACSCIGASQVQDTAKGRSTPELQIKILTDKPAYSITDTITTKIEFTNRSGKTLCFPEPAQGYELDAQGSLSTTAIPPGESGLDYFADHYDGGGTWPRKKLIQEIKDRWIWIEPEGTYVSKPVQPAKAMNKPGRWELKSEYVPPQGAFNPAKVRAYIRSAARAAGCVVPEMPVSAESIRVSVSP